MKLNAEKDGAGVAKKYGVNGFPTILFVDGTGAVEAKIVGYKGPGDFAQDLERIAAQHKDLPVLQERLKTNPGDAEASERLAAIYAGRGDANQAKQLLEQSAKADPRNTKGHLAKAYNALGDYYQEAQQYDKAVPLFREGAKVSRDPYDLAYARISIGVCYLSLRRTKEAVPEFEAVLRMTKAPKDLQDGARQMLRQIKGTGQRPGK